MKHAWLIIAHEEFEILKLLVSKLDHPDNDIFVHIDKKVKKIPDIHTRTSRLHILDERLDVRWGHYSQIETELLLLESALKQGFYQHCHIISGTHLPLKPIEVLLSFYDSHIGEEIMRMWPVNEGDADFKLRRYHFPIRDFKSSNVILRPVCLFLWKCGLKIQKILGIRHHKHERFIKADNWLSLSYEAARFIVSRKDDIIKKYRWSLCGDEYFIPSELNSARSHFRVYDCPFLLYVDFVKDSPRNLFLSDYPNLCKTDYLFARKFSNKTL